MNCWAVFNPCPVRVSSLGTSWRDLRFAPDVGVPLRPINDAVSRNGTRRIRFSVQHHRKVNWFLRNRREAAQRLWIPRLTQARFSRDWKAGGKDHWNSFIAISACDIRHMNSCYDCDNPISASPCDPVPGFGRVAESFRTSAIDSIRMGSQCQIFSADSRASLSWHPLRWFRPNNPRSANMRSIRKVTLSRRGIRLIRGSFQERSWTHPARQLQGRQC